MTRLVCVCGVVIEGEEELLEAVERHVAHAHPAAVEGKTASRSDARPLEGADHEVAQVDDERQGQSS